MDMGTASPEGWRTGPTDLLAELYTRAQLANRELHSLVDGQKKYFYVSTEAIIDVLDLPADKADMLRDFAEKAVNLLDKAYQQTETKLQKLLTALESNNVKVELGPRAKKTLHITPEGEKWYVSAHFRETWLISLPIYRVSADAEFPDILNVSDQDLYYLQAGWRASDESCDQNKPRMGTTQPWQALAWAAVRYGYLRIYLSALNLNMTEPTFAWTITSKSWNQQWPKREGKKLAQKIAEQHPLGMLTWYLGDGEKHPEVLRFAIQNDEKYEPKHLAQQILQVAYQTNYGILLDLLDSEKWQILKKLQPTRDPVYATLLGHTFWLSYSARAQQLLARTVLKSLEEAQRLIQALLQQGVQAKTYTWYDPKTGKNYYVVQLNGTNIARAAQLYPELRPALKELAQKHNIQPKTPLLRRLLELAENPPLPTKNLIS
ncbi:hypothetical protein TCARB_0030 [Thermofilum adornatum 1505]|uniref:Uncharacterized protein n=1 Tax=Thermofilum adornatum 1505 TaxID=697581 RepID=A0A3G1A587_9CREN|nr:hypothetical protein [Thermofilum adornatum]AJB41108.1 hypothetical protein TCARB_0030 [Thermofilum adornatum 1505]